MWQVSIRKLVFGCVQQNETLQNLANLRKHDFQNVVNLLITFQVVGIARRKERIEELANKLVGKKGKLYAVRADMTKEQDIIDAFEWTKKNVGSISILINNAGGLSYTTLTDGDTELWKRTIDLNVLGLCIATREAIKDMRANNIDGHIIHINSVTGHKVVNFPGINIYPASKFAVTALTESLRHELNSLNSKIKVTVSRLFAC